MSSCSESRLARAIAATIALGSIACRGSAVDTPALTLRPLNGQSGRVSITRPDGSSESCTAVGADGCRLLDWLAGAGSYRISTSINGAATRHADVILRDGIVGVDASLALDHDLHISVDYAPPVGLRLIPSEDWVRDYPAGGGDRAFFVLVNESTRSWQHGASMDVLWGATERREADGRWSHYAGVDCAFGSHTVVVAPGTRHAAGIGAIPLARGQATPAGTYRYAVRLLDTVGEPTAGVTVFDHTLVARVVEIIDGGERQLVP